MNPHKIPNTLLRAFAATLLFMAFALFARPAAAQEYLLGASGQIATGVVDGSRSAMTLARTRLRLGLDLRIDEFPKDVIAAGILAEIEPHASFGVDLRYVREVGPKFSLNIGAVGFLAPETLIGPAVGLDYKIRLTTAVAITVGPEFNVFVLGSDLPDGTIIWQALLQVGIHANL
jgi:hypothetical protein